MAPEISTASSFYVSAPTSPRHMFNQDNNGVRSFYSVPASPTRTSMFKEFDTNPATTASLSSSVTNEDENFNLDDFEFETSRRFNVDEYYLSEEDFERGKEFQQQQELHGKQRKESLPAMAFADELFCEGKVMPLKPPPRLQCGNDESFASHRSTPSSPNSLLRIPFTRRSLWNDDFDPFMVALENVKEDKSGNHRRSRSTFASFPACMSEQSFHEDLFSCTDNGNIQRCKKYYSMPNPGNHTERNGSSWNQNGNTEQKSPLKLAEPKGVVFARRARLVKMVNEFPKKPSGSAFPELKVEAGQGYFGKENSGGSWSGEHNKRQRSIKNFLFKSSSMKKGGDDYKQGEQYLEPKKPKITRKLSLKSKGMVHNSKVEKAEEKRIDENVENDQDLEVKKSKITRKLSSRSVNLVQCKGEEKVSEVTKMTLVRYKPRLLLCMGLGAKYVK